MQEKKSSSGQAYRPPAARRGMMKACLQERLHACRARTHALQGDFWKLLLLLFYFFLENPTWAFLLQTLLLILFYISIQEFHRAAAVHLLPPPAAACLLRAAVVEGACLPVLSCVCSFRRAGCRLAAGKLELGPAPPGRTRLHFGFFWGAQAPTLLRRLIVGRGGGTVMSSSTVPARTHARASLQLLYSSSGRRKEAHADFLPSAEGSILGTCTCMRLPARLAGSFDFLLLLFFLSPAATRLDMIFYSVHRWALPVQRRRKLARLLPMTACKPAVPSCWLPTVFIFSSSSALSSKGK